MRPLESYASRDFWELYHKLPNAIRESADKQFALFQQDPSHPSLHLKPVGDFWSARITDAYRTLALRQGNTFYWFWIGNHDEMRDCSPDQFRAITYPIIPFLLNPNNLDPRRKWSPCTST